MEVRSTRVKSRHYARLKKSSMVPLSAIGILANVQEIQTPPCTVTQERRPSKIEDFVCLNSTPKYQI